MNYKFISQWLAFFLLAGVITLGFFCRIYYPNIPYLGISISLGYLIGKYTKD